MLQKVAYIKFIGTITYDETYAQSWGITSSKGDSELASQLDKFCLIFNKELFDLIDISIAFSSDTKQEKAYLKVVVVNKEKFDEYLSGLSIHLSNSVVLESYNLHMLRNQNTFNEIISGCEKIYKFNAAFMRESYKLSKAKVNFEISEISSKLDSYNSHLERISEAYNNFYDTLTDETKLELDITNRRE